MRNFFSVLILTIFISTATERINAGTCSNAGKDVIQNFCYDSGYPLRIMGNTTQSGSDIPEPPFATTQSECKCGEDPYALHGYTKGMWLPTRMVEVVRRADCSPVYGESVKQMLSQMANISSTISKITRQTAGDAMLPHETGFRHFHSWEFPLYDIYDWVPRCFERGGNLETSITNPFWSSKDQVWMNMLYPEWMVIGSSATAPLVDLPAHTASCVANTTGVGQALDDWVYWLGGCDSNNLPAAGSYSDAKNSVIATQSIVNRSVMLSNRTGGFASVSTVGDKSLCMPVPVPYPSKSEFKFTMMFPYPESKANSNNESTGALGSVSDDSLMIWKPGGGPNQTSDNRFGQVSGESVNWTTVSTRCAHRWGSAPLIWGTGRSDQANNNNDSDAVYLIWRWVDCCEFGI